MNKICVIASGGDAPGMNACFEAIYLHATELGFETYAAVSGYDGLINSNFVKLTAENACGISDKSGCVFKCSRSPKFMTKDGFATALVNIKKHAFQGVIVIGGNGSFAGVGCLKGVGAPVVGIPATIDNDVFFTKHNLGFSSATESAVEMVDMLRATMETNNRDHVVQLMGRSCNELAKMVGTATFADVIDMDGNRHTPEQVAAIFAVKRKQGKKSNFMIMQERRSEDVVQEAIDSANFLKELSIASGNKSIRMNILGHLQRGAKPSCRDRFLAVSYGRAAVDCVVNKQFGLGIAMIDGQIQFIEIEANKAP